MRNLHQDMTSPFEGDKRGSLKELSAIMLLIAGLALAFIALFLPPPGEIHDSVLFIFAQILIYAGSIFGIDSYICHKLKSPPKDPHRPSLFKEEGVASEDHKNEPNNQATY